MVDTGNKFIISFVDAAEQLPPVTMTPAINYRRYQRHRRAIIAADNNTGYKFIAGINDSGEQ
jgi:hypothetical protein